MCACHSIHQGVKSIFLLLHLIWSHVLLCWVEYGWSNAVPVPGPDFTRPGGFLFLSETASYHRRSLTTLRPPWCEEAQTSHKKRPCGRQSRNSVDSENWGFRQRSPVKPSSSCPNCLSYPSWGCRHHRQTIHTVLRFLTHRIMKK